MMQISPPKQLACYIKHYIFLENPENDSKNMRLFADGNTGLIISADMNMHDSRNKNLPLSFFYGQPTHYKDLITKGSFSLLAVVFQPYFFNLLFNVAAKEIKNEIISSTDILKDQLIPFQERLYQKTDPLSIINDLNAFFLQLISKKETSDLWLIKAQQYLLQNKGTASLKDLEHFTGYSERHLERKFESHIGISPKKYNTIIRLHHFLSLMKNDTNKTNMTSLSYEAGYSDQSHLIKDFKNTIGLTPSQYLKTKNKLAVNFIEL
ncbi:AraC family transcriptional regulator [Chryseobacterium sp. T16E-39]|uniref:AraC family transcriptional regulator n=1 Tax=Chryseobacterium sp. T16E-39 TaxID=2015076 RepID=UPI000B5B192F|nr:helix-turn-helix domain-containing protein [Chryseobacterium sp. T16E-39]ASK29186.1 AraC family transcriptional regulator [Chryseobacterium sp. T16E-39]